MEEGANCNIRYGITAVINSQLETKTVVYTFAKFVFVCVIKNFMCKVCKRHFLILLLMLLSNIKSNKGGFK